MPFHVRKNPVGTVKGPSTFYYKVKSEGTYKVWICDWVDSKGVHLGGSIGFHSPVGFSYIQSLAFAERGYGILYYMLLSKLMQRSILPSSFLSEDALVFWSRPENKNGIVWDLNRWNELTRNAPIPKFVRADVNELDIKKKFLEIKSDTDQYSDLDESEDDGYLYSLGY